MNNHIKKDRIICVTTTGSHDFYLKSGSTNSRIWLFRTPFSGSTFSFFRDYGRCMDGIGYSLTLGELNRFKKFHNPKLSKLMERLPKAVKYAYSQQTAPLTLLPATINHACYDYNELAG